MITQRDIDYARRAIILNPVSHAENIVSLRSEWRADDDEVETLEPVEINPAERQRELALRIDEIRQEFWTLDEVTLLHKLDRLKVDDFPYLTLTCKLLKSVATRRMQFQRLQAHPHCFPEFLDVLQEIAIATPAKATLLREKLRSTAARGIAYPGCRSSREYRRLAQTIDRDFPELASLYGSFLSEIQYAHSWKRLLPKLFGEAGGLFFQAVTRGASIVVLFGAIYAAKVLLRVFQ